MDKTNTKDSEKEKSDVSELTSSYILPVGSFVIALVLVLTLVLPAITGIFSKFEEINDLRIKHDQLQARKTVREGLGRDFNTNLAVLNKIKEIIPQSQTSVGDFSEKIRQIAVGNNLQLSGSTVGEVSRLSVAAKDDPGAVLATSNLELVELPAEFSLSGTFADITKFLTDIFQGGDFIIIKKMELQKQLTGSDNKFSTKEASRWVMSITLTKYQFRVIGSQNEKDINAVYFAVPEESKPNSEIVEFIRDNYLSTTSSE